MSANSTGGAKVDAEWQSYEELAQYLLNKFAKEFGLSHVEGKQHIDAAGTTWEIDGKGVMEDGHSFFIVECKRYTTSRINQETVGGLAFRMDRSGASGGIIVSPLGLQQGAEKVAEHEGIIEVKLREDSTNTVYLMSFLNQLCVGFHDTVSVGISEHLTIKIFDEDGNLKETREYRS